MSPQELLSLCGLAPATTFNPWFERCAHDLDPLAAEARRARMAVHLSCPDARLLLIGEAAGYQGCRYSGIPFTSERLLLENAIPGMPDLAQRRITDRNRPFSEPSASILWGTLHELQVAGHTVLWNACPWHPYGAKDWSNRRPTAAELAAGRPLLEAVISMYPQARVVAVGGVAEAALARLGIAGVRVRHPAYGGANAFRQGLRGLLA